MNLQCIKAEWQLLKSVIPAQTEITSAKNVDSRLRGNDNGRYFRSNQCHSIEANLIKRNYKAHLLKRNCVMFLLSTALGIVSGTHLPVSHAAIYKCVDNSGNTSYTGAPCPTDESIKLISNSAFARPALDCRVARKFAENTSQRMLAGESSDDLFNSYGGVNTITPFAMSLISYVYSFEGNQRMTTERLTALSNDRCEANSFGPVGRQCDAFPEQFIEGLGGCSGILDNNEQASAFARPVTTNYALPLLGEANPLNTTVPSAVKTATSNQRSTCQERLLVSINNTASEMREQPAAHAQEKLIKRHRHLRSQLTRC